MLAFNDKQIIEGIRQGEGNVLNALYRDMMPKIKRLAAASGMTAEDARDVFQDAVVIVFEKTEQPDFVLSSSFSTYFYGICRNLFGNRLKKKSGRHVTIPEEAKYSSNNDDDAQTLMEAAERHRMFHRAFRQLGEDCRHLLEMSFENEPPEVIMAKLQISSNDYFRRRKYLCKEKLILLVQNDPAYQELVKSIS
jgi:RNA polymerase sigma factor (sigma-70 family)